MYTNVHYSSINRPSTEFRRTPASPRNRSLLRGRAVNAHRLTARTFEPRQNSPKLQHDSSYDFATSTFAPTFGARAKFPTRQNRESFANPRANSQIPSAGWSTFGVLERVFISAQNRVAATAAIASTCELRCKTFGARSVQKSSPGSPVLFEIGVTYHGAIVDPVYPNTPNSQFPLRRWQLRTPHSALESLRWRVAAKRMASGDCPPHQ
jgi:hypothetical protein